MSSVQVEEIRRTRQVPTHLRITAPAEGIVASRSVSPGQRLERGDELFTIADLRRVWILADVFGPEAEYVRPGMVAQVSSPARAGTFGASVSRAVQPQFDAATQTVNVRFEADNPGNVLRPGMFVDVALPVTLPEALVVPVDAVLDSGLKKTVFVERAQGVFEPRAVETGWRFGDRVQIVKGLEAGERIVVAGTFLLDSESKLRHFSGTRP
jgi:membrane fusion protein, copper/silver efflux system